jgi:hypothetical protein
VLHRDLRREFRLDTVPVLMAVADEHHRDLGRWVERARARFGAPRFEDETLIVFQLR